MKIITIVEAVVYSVSVLFASFLITEIIKYFKTFKSIVSSIAFIMFCVCVAVIVYLVIIDNAFMDIVILFVSNIYVCLTIIVLEVLTVFAIGYAQISRQLDITARERQTVNSINGWNLDFYTKLLLTFIIRAKAVLVTVIAYPILGLITIIVSKSGVLPQGFDFTLIGYGMFFYGGIFMLVPLPTKFSLYLDGMYLMDKNFLKPLLESYLKINFIVNFGYLMIVLPIFKDYVAIDIFLFNVSLMPLIGNLAIVFKQCVRLDIFNPNEHTDGFSSVVMFLYLGLYTFVWLINTIFPKIGFYMSVIVFFISILFWIIRKVWINKLTEIFIENHYDIIEEVRR